MLGTTIHVVTLVRLMYMVRLLVLGPEQGGAFAGRAAEDSDAPFGHRSGRQELGRPVREPEPRASLPLAGSDGKVVRLDRKSTRLNSSHSQISYAVFCLKKKKTRPATTTSAARRA